MEHISVIVPIYQGKKYIRGMLAQIEMCALTGRDRYTLELVLVNDDPAEPIGVVSSGAVPVRVMETDTNRGIHGARICGLEHCTGDYVLFLDQDDRIYPAYFSSQLSHLEKADAVVCKLLHESRAFYDTRMPFERVVSREYIISVRNPIISPGQVLIRKDKIPAEWKETKLKNNGADDWLLWLCMLGADAKFSLNPEILFEHVVEGGNESINASHMIASEKEIYEVVRKGRILPLEETEKLRGAVRAAEEGHIKLLSKFQKMFFVYDDWINLQEQGWYMHQYLKGIGAGSAAVYGDSYIGKRLYQNLSNNGIEVRYFIDRNAAYLEEEIPVYQPQKGLPPVDVILISLVEGIEEIKKDLRVLTKGRVYSVAEILAEMRKGL